jgi:hypothetical protein
MFEWLQRPMHSERSRCRAGFIIQKQMPARVDVKMPFFPFGPRLFAAFAPRPRISEAICKLTHEFLTRACPDNHPRPQPDSDKTLSMLNVTAPRLHLLLSFSSEADRVSCGVNDPKVPCIFLLSRGSGPSISSHTLESQAISSPFINGHQEITQIANTYDGFLHSQTRPRRDQPGMDRGLCCPRQLHPCLNEGSRNTPVRKACSNTSTAR